MLEKGANPNVVISGFGPAIPSKEGFVSAFDIAVITDHPDAAKLLPAVGKDGSPLAGEARAQHMAMVTEAYNQYQVKSKLSKIVSSLDPIKVSMAMYYQEQGAFPGKKETLDPANSGKSLPPGSLWSMVGFTVYPALPPEVASLTYIPFGVGQAGAESFGLVITFRNIKPDTVDGQLVGISPSDDMVITGPGSAASKGGGVRGSSALTFHYSCHQMTGRPVDPVVTKFFSNSGVQLVCG